MIARLARAPEWVGLLAVVLLAAGLRLWNLGNPATLVFDETYYVKDAWTLLHLGYEGSWPEGANDAFIRGDVDGFSNEPSFVVHPPLGKWIIALGLAAVGADSPVGWRIGVAVVGILTAALVWLLARVLFGSAPLALLAGTVFALDGHAIVTSRIALLDGMLAFFTTLGALFVLLDQGWLRRRLRTWVHRRAGLGQPIDWGPVLWNRPWLVAAGVAFGLATAVKWSGLWFLAVFGIYAVVSEALARRRAGIPFWFSGTALRQAPASFVLMVPVAAIVYAVTWAGWFRSDSGYARQWAAGVTSSGEPRAWDGPFGWVPLDWQSWWHYHQTAYNFHTGLDSEHAWASPAWEWMLLLRPTALHRAYSSAEEDGCSTARCESFITTLPNPLAWYLAVAAMLVLVALLVWRVLRPVWSRVSRASLPRVAPRTARRAGFIITGITAGWAPWLLYPDRTTFQFYAIVFLPFMVLALTQLLGMLLRGGRETSRSSRVAIVATLLALIALFSAYFYPVWVGIPAPELFTRSHYWLPGWR